MKTITMAIIVFFIAVAAITIVTLTSQSHLRIGAIENIHGVPFPQAEGSVIVTERLAHADIYLKQPSLAKQLILTITFTPYDTPLLAVGIRENPFWLSYPKYVLYEKKSGTPAVSSSTTKTVSIPLTDKIVDQGRSVDLMFFASPPGFKDTEDAGVLDTTYWQLHDLTGQVAFYQPNKTELKDYLKSILTREKPL